MDVEGTSIMPPPVPVRVGRIAGRYESADWSPTRVKQGKTTKSSAAGPSTPSRDRLGETGNGNADEQSNGSGRQLPVEDSREKHAADSSYGPVEADPTSDYGTATSDPVPLSHVLPLSTLPGYTRRVGRRTTRVRLPRKARPPPSLSPLTPLPHSPALSSVPAHPPHLSPFITAFGPDSLSSLQDLARLDSIGSRLPPPLSDVFHLLSDPNPSVAVRVANALRRALGVELIPPVEHVDRVGLRRAIALARDDAYIGAVAAMSLPLAPTEVDPTHGDEEKEGKAQVRLTEFNKPLLVGKLKEVFPVDRKRLELGAAGVYGEEGEVVWKAGVGRMRGDGNGGGYRSASIGRGSGGVHIFLDYSNILYGLLDFLSTRDATSLPPRHQRILSLTLLSLLLLRGRSHPSGSLHAVASSPVRQDLDPLVRCGWEVSVLKRVEIGDTEVDDVMAEKMVPVPVGRKGRDEGLGSGRFKEQGVDEVLCLKMLQTLNACGVREAAGQGGGGVVGQAPKGGVVVLATGDARGGQFNADGFLGAVREALARGWIVELWSFKSGLSRSWAEVAKREGWDHRFGIHTLDPFGEWLVEVGDER